MNFNKHLYLQYCSCSTCMHATKYHMRSTLFHPKMIPLFTLSYTLLAFMGSYAY